MTHNLIETKLNTNTMKRFCIIVPSYNNAKNYRENLDSIFEQKYTNYYVLYFDDASNDNTNKLVHNYVNKLSTENKNKIHIFKNHYNSKQGCAKYIAAHFADNNDILIFLDGDDWLNNINVLNYLNDVYSLDENVWLTYGSVLEYYKGKYKKLNISRKLDTNIIKNNEYRMGKQGFITSHLRTCYAWVYKLIPLEYLLSPTHKFLPFSTDVAEMRCQIELVGFHHKFITKRLYVYNRDNSLQYTSSYKYRKNNKESQIIRKHIKNMPVLSPLSSPIHSQYSFNTPILIDDHICVLYTKPSFIVNNVIKQYPIKEMPKTYEEYNKLSNHNFYLLLDTDMSKNMNKFYENTKSNIELMIRFILNTKINIFMLDWNLQEPRIHTHLTPIGQTFSKNNVVFFPIRKTQLNNWSGMYSKDGLLKYMYHDTTKHFSQRLALGFIY